MINSSKSHQRGSALIMSVALTALMITASLSISVAIAAVARNTSLLAAANQSFFAAEGGIEEGIYKVTKSDPGEAITAFGFEPDNGSASNTSVLNSLAPGESIDLALAPQESVALYLYNGGDPITVDNFTLELEIKGDDITAFGNIKSDFSLQDGEINSFNDHIGEALVSPTINLRKENGAEWGENDTCDEVPLYQQVDSSLWCPICPNWIIVPDDTCQDLTAFSNITNLETDSYPIAAGTGIATDLIFSVYDDTNNFYLDKDDNDLVSSGSTAKFTILTEADNASTNNYYREINQSDYPDHNTPIFTLDATAQFRNTAAPDEDPSYINDILSENNPVLIISNYNIPQTLTLKYKATTLPGSYLPSPTINITAIGSKGEAAQKITAVMAYRNQVPVFQQSIIY